MPPQWAIAAICLGQTVGNSVAALAFLWISQRQLGGLPLRHIGRLLLQLLLASVPAGLFAWFLVAWLAWLHDFSWSSSLLALGAGGAAFVAIFLVLAALLRIKELDALWARLPLSRWARSEG